MAKVIKEDLMKIKKEYAVGRRTVIEDGKEAVFIEKKIPEQEVMFIMDRFGYAKTIDMAAYERNKEAVHNEYKYIFSCMNTDKICILLIMACCIRLKLRIYHFLQNLGIKVHQLIISAIMTAVVNV